MNNILKASGILYLILFLMAILGTVFKEAEILYFAEFFLIVAFTAPATLFIGMAYGFVKELFTFKPKTQ